VGSDLSTISEPRSRSQSEIDATYKSRELEGIVDLFFYRRIGFHLAQFFARLNFTPTAVTLIGGVFGVVAGHLYFYQALAINLVGMLFHVVANIFDNADGQLARLTNQQSRTGRILDPIVDHVIWLSVYVHLALRLQIGGFSGAIWILGLAAGLSHGLQAGAADYCRNAYLYFGKGGSDFDSTSKLKQEYDQHTWREAAWPKFLLRLYLNATREQELLLPGVKRLREMTESNFVDAGPAWLQSRYRTLVLPTFKWWSLLMTNTRMLVLFVLFLVHQPVWYFWLEITAGNLLLVYLIFRQEKISRSLVQFLTTQKDSA
jgi:phosphatidylglycerophosphate synthase